MKIESLSCPNCAKTLQLSDLSENVKFAKCPACGAQLHIDYEQGGNAAAGGNRDPRKEIIDDATGKKRQEYYKDQFKIIVEETYYQCMTRNLTVEGVFVFHVFLL